MYEEEASGYWLAISTIEAQQTLLKLRLMDWPNMKKQDRQSWHRQLHKVAYPETHSGKELSTKDLAARIQAAVNG